MDDPNTNVPLSNPLNVEAARALQDEKERQIRYGSPSIGRKSINLLLAIGVLVVMVLALKYVPRLF